MENNYTIYCHLNKINNKRYIGQTKQPVQKRWGKNGSEYTRKHPNTLIARAINKYGWDNFEHQILFEHLTKIEANKKEIELISFYKSNDPNFGYNITAGGNTNTLSQEQKKQKTELNYKMWQDGTFKKIINTPVYCIELQLGFESALEAQRATGIDNSSIQKVCKKQLNYAGFLPNGQPIHWIYLNEKTDDIIQELYNKKEIIKGTAIPVECIELNEIFNSTTEVKNKYGISPNNIRACITGKVKSAGKHPITKEPLHWIERLDLINNKNKITQEKLEELLK